MTGIAATGKALPEWARAPLRVGAFRAVCLAAVVSNLGSWMHIVAAGWLMASLTSAVGLVALQAANAIPDFLLVHLTYRRASQVAGKDRMPTVHGRARQADRPRS